MGVTQVSKCLKLETTSCQRKNIGGGLTEALSPKRRRAGKLTVASRVQLTWLVVGFRFCYSVFSTYNFDTYKFLYQHEQQ